ncbi:DUF992 domain-containing protein [Nitrospinota bacterium]
MKIICRIGFVLIVASLISAIQLPVAGAAEKTGGVHLGSLVCKSQPGTRVQIFLRSSVAIKCTFKTAKGEERYKGEIGFLGIDLSKKSEETLNFTVVGLTTNINMGDHTLAGDYAGASVSAGVYKEGYGSTQFVGGIQKNFSLIPSLDTFKGTGISAGVSRMKLLADK